MLCINRCGLPRGREAWRTSPEKRPSRPVRLGAAPRITVVSSISINCHPTSLPTELLPVRNFLASLTARTQRLCKKNLSQRRRKEKNQNPSSNEMNFAFFFTDTLRKQALKIFFTPSFLFLSVSLDLNLRDTYKTTHWLLFLPFCWCEMTLYQVKLFLRN